MHVCICGTAGTSPQGRPAALCGVPGNCRHPSPKCQVDMPAGILTSWQAALVMGSTFCTGQAAALGHMPGVTQRLSLAACHRLGLTAGNIRQLLQVTRLPHSLASPSAVQCLLSLLHSGTSALQPRGGMQQHGLCQPCNSMAPANAGYLCLQPASSPCWRTCGWTCALGPSAT